MEAFLLRHLQALIFALGQLARTPAPTAMTIAVVGIGLALPAGLLVTVDNLVRAGAAWEVRPQLSMYLDSNLSAGDIDRVRKTALGLAEGASIDYIPPERGLAEFREQSGFSAALDRLSRNPLPPVLILYPDAGFGNSNLNDLAGSLRHVDGVEHVELDLAWLERLQSLIRLAQRSSWLIAAVLIAGLGLIIANTTRIAVVSRAREIRIINLIGGSDRFIRRPFLYSGLLLGAGGGLLAWMLVQSLLGLLKGPLDTVSASYGADWTLTGLGFRRGMGLAAIGGALGWAATRITLGRYLRRLSPDADGHAPDPEFGE